ncbi:MAG TPA: lysylphosphatidylglycerol synthase transmembrane domain-containing protein [Humibacillus xanthopallidus]|nr:lysylphosphatidylglycerol synthase transmembrane domain-containing protein [Humibacillus xanthopallidus]
MGRDRRWVRPLVGVAILGLLGWRFGAGAFVDGLRRIDGWTLLAGATIGVVTTVCGAWRWVLVSRGLGAPLPLRTAIAECYRSQFLNVTLPGGVIGDVRRGVGHGHGSGDVGRGLRSVLWERTAGQVVLAALTVGALLVLPSPLRSSATVEMPSASDGARRARVFGSVGESSSLATSSITVALLCLVVLVALAAVGRRRGLLPGPGLPRRVGSALVRDVRAGVLGRHTWPGVVAASGVVVTGHVATFVVAARSAGVSAPAPRLMPLALIVLVAMSLPLNVAGWGPREGAAAWAFGAAGLGATAGVATAVVYGVMSLVACLPGAVLLVMAGRRRSLGTPTVVAQEAVRV